MQTVPCYQIAWVYDFHRKNRSCVAFKKDFIYLFELSIELYSSLSSIFPVNWTWVATRGLSRQQAANKGSCIYYILSGFVPHITMWFSHRNLYMQQGWCMCNQNTWSVYDVCLVVILSAQGFHCCDHSCVTCHSVPCYHGTGQLHLTWSDLSMSTGVLPEPSWLPM